MKKSREISHTTIPTGIFSLQILCLIVFANPNPFGKIVFIYC